MPKIAVVIVVSRSRLRGGVFLAIEPIESVESIDASDIHFNDIDIIDAVDITDLGGRKFQQ